MTSPSAGNPNRSGAPAAQPAPVILHVDMDAFFASVELLDNGHARGKPAVVAHDSPRSVVTSATYEARALGIRSAMSLAMARRICPQVIVLEPHFAKYQHYSGKVMEIFRSFTPLVEPLSIDEAFLDVSGARRAIGDGAFIASEIRRRVLHETGLTCSVGIATTKFIAKLASQSCKPDGVLEIAPDRVLEFLHPLPIRALWGVGPQTAKVLERRGIHTVADIADTPVSSLVSALGEGIGRQLHELANGQDERPVFARAREKSISRAHTFDSDVTDIDTIRALLLSQSDRVARSLREAGLDARTISIGVTFANFQSVSRSATLKEPTQTGREILGVALELLSEFDPRIVAIRLLSVRASNLIDAGSSPVGLWSDGDEAWTDVENTIDDVAAKFGDDAVRPASLLKRTDLSARIGESSD
jgi:DNA polymerase-4